MRVLLVHCLTNDKETPDPVLPKFLFNSNNVDDITLMTYKSSCPYTLSPSDIVPDEDNKVISSDTFTVFAIADTTDSPAVFSEYAVAPVFAALPIVS